MRRLVLVVPLLLGLPAAAGPGDLLARARQEIARKDCASAVATLREGMKQVAAIAEAATRDQAAGAFHFYSAVALHDCRKDEEAKTHLREFFRLQPSQSSLDGAKYTAGFVRLFDQVQRERPGTAMFDAFYPGFDDAEAVAEEEVPLVQWSTGPAFQLFADDAERDAWSRARTDEARQDVIDRFWARRDSASAGARSSFRAAIARRVAFADRHFDSPDELRGAMSDRGRVFVLLGPPGRVSKQALGRYDTTVVGQRTRVPITGNLERWVYFRPQLPVGIAAQQVEFRFITQPGYGDHVMQRDFWALKALAEARRAPAGAE